MAEINRDFDALIALCKTSWSEVEVIAAIERLRMLVHLEIATKATP